MRIEKTDVVVVGAGMAGVMAALAVAKRDCEVWLIEPSNVVGGQGTAGGVAGFCGDTDKVNDVFDELVARMLEHGFIHELNPLADRRDYELEWCAYFLQEMLVASGAKLLLHARVLDAKADGGALTELTVSSASEVFCLKPKVVVDATGLCIVPERAGFSVQHDGANAQLPMSLYFTLWDSGKPVQPFLPPGLPKWQNDQEIPMTSLHIFDSGKVEVKMKVTGFDGADGLSLSEAEMHARRQMVALIYYLQTQGYRGVKLDSHVLASVSRHIGVREQRRLDGEHCLRESEVTSGAVFPDAVAVGTYHLDFHWPDRPERGSTGITTMVEPYHIPLRCMIPKGATNILVPGRGAAAEQMALSSFRVMATVAQMGFACGVAAVHALRAGRAVTELDIRHLQADLESSGQCLDLNQYGAYLRNTICTEEIVCQPTGKVKALHLGRLENGGFRTRFVTDVGTSALDRREGKWQVAEVGGALEPAVEALVLDGQHQVRLSAAEPGVIQLSLSADDGMTWSHHCALRESNSNSLCSIVATPRGIAVAYIDVNDRIRFWHGAIEHIMGTGVNRGKDHES